MTTHPWILTAPWWHWPRLGSGGPHPRDTRPALQKYATADVVNELLADPQRRLAFTAGDLAEAPRHGAAAGVPLASPGRLRKLYLPSHHRHYLVVCELHCDAPGLPTPGRDQVCDAGFVIRRRTLSVPPEAGDETRRLVRQLTLARARLGALERKIERSRRTNGVAQARLELLRQRRDKALGQVDERHRGLREWATAVGAQRGLQGWFPLGAEPVGPDDTPVPAPLPERPARRSGLRPLAGLGRWQTVAETPDELTEATVPLHPLVADPGEVDHDAAGLTVYFGLVPTSTAELELTPPPVRPEDRPNWIDRTPRFRDIDLYEICCFVRRHDPGCPRRPGERDCHGELTWSEPTPAYRLAGHLDLRGTAHRPATIVMPDLAELRAQAPALVGMGGVRVNTPPGSQLDTPRDPTGDDFQICSFAIPLITIVAMFVLKLFLPIVVFVFQLWWLLALRLCIPPSISLSGGLAAELEVRPPEIEIEAGLRVDIQTSIDRSTATVTRTTEDMGGDENTVGKIPTGIKDGVLGQTGADRYPAVRALFGTSGLRAPDDELRYAPRVERAEVFVT